jgi:hypothetical protein
MPLAGGALTLYDIGYQHLILLQDIHDMAFLAGEVPVFALFPCLESFLHHMAGHAELGVLFRMLVIPEADDPPDNGYHKQEQDD